MSEQELKQMFEEYRLVRIIRNILQQFLNTVNTFKSVFQSFASLLKTVYFKKKKFLIFLIFFFFLLRKIRLKKFIIEKIN
jgi:hypothetical protein